MQPATKGIAGHEGAGVVVAVGDDMHHKWKVGDRAGIKWVWGVCGECEFCTNGTDELHCPKQKNSGFTAAGTFQQYALSDGRYTTRIPEGVKDEEAGPIMCGGVTAYVACKRSAVKPGQWIVLLPIYLSCGIRSLTTIHRCFPVLVEVLGILQCSTLRLWYDTLG